MIPLRVAGETVRLEYAGMGYAFLTAFSNVTGMFEAWSAPACSRSSSSPALAGLAAGRLPGLGPDHRAHRRPAHADPRAVRLHQPALHAADDPFSPTPKRELDRRGIVVYLGAPPEGAA
jgi:hypothetical protein